MKKLFVMFAALALLAGSTYAAEKILLKLPPLESTNDYGVIKPAADNTVDIGTSDVEFRNLYLDGTAKVDTLTVDEVATFSGTATFDSVTTIYTVAYATNTTASAVGEIMFESSSGDVVISTATNNTSWQKIGDQS